MSDLHNEMHHQGFTVKKANHEPKVQTVVSKEQTNEKKEEKQMSDHKKEQSPILESFEAIIKKQQEGIVRSAFLEAIKKSKTAHDLWVLLGNEQIKPHLKEISVKELFKVHTVVSMSNAASDHKPTKVKKSKGPRITKEEREELAKVVVAVVKASEGQKEDILKKLKSDEVEKVKHVWNSPEFKKTMKTFGIKTKGQKPNVIYFA